MEMLCCCGVTSLRSIFLLFVSHPCFCITDVGVYKVKEHRLSIAIEYLYLFNALHGIIIVSGVLAFP